MVTHEPDMAAYARRMVHFVDGRIDSDVPNPHPRRRRHLPRRRRRRALMLFNTFLLALRSIRRNLLRSFLTILGIVIGVSAVITMVTLGNGATQAVQTQISSLGTNLLMVRPGQRQGPGGGGGGPACRRSRRPMPRRSWRRSAASPRWRPKAAPASPWSANGRNWATSVTGSSNAWFDTGNWKLASGRMFEADEQSAGCRRLHHRRDGAARNLRRHGGPAAWASSCASSSSPAR